MHKRGPRFTHEKKQSRRRVRSTAECGARLRHGRGAPRAGAAPALWLHNAHGPTPLRRQAGAAPRGPAATARAAADMPPGAGVRGGPPASAAAGGRFGRARRRRCCARRRAARAARLLLCGSRPHEPGDLRADPARPGSSSAAVVSCSQRAWRWPDRQRLSLRLARKRPVQLCSACTNGLAAVQRLAPSNSLKLFGAGP